MILEEGIFEAFDKWIIGIYQEKFGTKNVTEENIAKIRNSTAPKDRILVQYHDNGGRPGMERKFRQATGPVVNKFRQNKPKRKS